MFLVLYRERLGWDRRRSRNSYDCCGSARPRRRPTRASRPVAPGPSLAHQILRARPAAPRAARAARGRGSGRSPRGRGATRSSPARGARRPSTTRSSAAALARRATRAAVLHEPRPVEPRPFCLLRSAVERACFLNHSTDRASSVSLDSDLYTMCLVFSAVLRLDCNTFDECAACLGALPAFLLSASGFARPRGIDDKRRVLATVSYKIRRGKAPRSCRGQPFLAGHAPLGKAAPARCGGTHPWRHRRMSTRVRMRK